MTPTYTPTPSQICEATIIIHVCQDSNGDGSCSPGEAPLADQTFDIVADDGRRWRLVSDQNGQIVLSGFKSGQSVTVTQIIDPDISPWLVSSTNPLVATLGCGDNHLWFANRLPGLPTTGIELEEPERSWQLKEPPAEAEAVQPATGIEIVPERSWELREQPAGRQASLPPTGTGILPERSWEFREPTIADDALPSITTDTGKRTAGDIFEAPIHGWIEIGGVRIPLGETRVEGDKLLVLNQAGGWSLGSKGGIWVNWHASQFPLERIPIRGDRVFVYYAGQRRYFEVERRLVVRAGQEGRLLQNAKRGQLVAVTCIGQDWRQRLLIMTKEIKQ